MSARGESEVSVLRRLADELAKGRSERVTTGHLLAAIAKKGGTPAELLRERRLDEDVLLRAARVLTDDSPDAVKVVLERAREFAARSGAREPSALHVLFALCQERKTAAHRAIEQCGVDVTKLRMAAMQIATGLVEPRRTVSRRAVQLPLVATPARTQTRAAPVSPPSQVARPTPKPSVPPSAPRLVIAPPHRRKVRAPDVRRTTPMGRFSLDPKLFPTLSTIGKNLTQAAEAGALDGVVARETEIDRVLDILAKRHSNNPCLVGVAGVGKTSVVRGLAQRIAASQDASLLDDRIVIEIDSASLLVGTGARGSLAERIAQIRAEVKRAEGRVVVFFDEIHLLVGADAGQEASGELKAALALGELPCIGATTPEELKRALDADPPLARRFTVIEVGELSPEEATVALIEIAPRLEAHHRLRFSSEALDASVQWTSRYVPGRPLPDKAISVLDLAGARARRRGAKEIGREQVAEVVAETALVPIERLLETDAQRMLRLEELMGERVVGHKDSIARIAAVLRRNASGFRSQRPIGTFLLLGPTGVGKTETAKAIAECLFFSPHAMTRLDLSEYAEPHSIARLVGAPPGYVGHEAGGQLTEALRKRPYQVVLLDEIEKAHRDVLEAFLQVFDEGRMTDGRGRTIDFTNAVIVLTSNLGSDVAQPSAARGRIGFGSRSVGAASGEEAYRNAIIAAARSALPPELYNRIDEVLAYAALGRSDVTEVARRMLVTLGEDLERARGIRLEVAEGAIEALLDAGGFDPALGARPMRRAIGRLVEAPLAEMILRGDIDRGDVALLEIEDGRLVVDAVRPRKVAGS
jgi:ATP-dependent Clp protease ATP-binding subunit ClpC